MSMSGRTDRRVRGVCVLAACLALGGSAFAAEQLPPPKASGDGSPPVEVTISAEGSGTRCEPAELRMPADSDVSLTFVNQAPYPATVTAAKQFENKQVLHHDGGVVHIANESGFTVRGNVRGEVKLRTLPPGEYEFSCATTRSQGQPFHGKLVLVAPDKK
jgi:plastocyanin